MATKTFDLTKVDASLVGYDATKGDLVGLLHKIQAECSYLPEEAVEHVAEKTGVPVSRIHSLTTFFKAFALEPRGQHLITVCLGTSCHVMGCRTILEKVQRELGVKPGETTEDGRFTLETVNCIGACAVSPVVVVDGETYAKMTITKVNRLLRPLVRSGEQPVAV